MEYEIKDIQTVKLFLTEESPGEDITTVEVLFVWGSGYSSSSRIEIKGRPTDDEILENIKRRGAELKETTQEEIGKGLAKKGTL